MSNRTSKAFKGTVASFLQYGIYIILQAMLAPLVLKVAGQEVLGVYSVVMQIVGYGILLDLGFSVALSRFLSQTYASDDRGSRFVEVFTIGRVFLLITNLIFAGCILLVAFQIQNIIVVSDLIVIQARLALTMLAVWTILRTPLALYNHGLMATQNMVASNIISIIGNMSRLLISLGFVYTGFGLIGLIAANIFSEGITFASQTIYFKKKYPDYVFGWKVTDKKLFKEIFSFGIKYWGVNLAVVFFLGSDSIIVANLYNANAASVYYTTKIPAFLLMQFVFRLSDNAAPAANELFAKRQYDALQSAYLKILRYSLLIAIPLAIGVIGFNKAVITAWVGPAQFAGDVMSLSLALFIITQVINHINAMITLAVGDMRGWSTVSIATSLISLGLSYILGKYIGLQWVMVAIFLMDIPNALFLFTRSISGLKISLIRLWREALKPSLIASIPLFGLVVYLKITNPAMTIYSLIAFGSVFSVIWAFSLIILALTKAEQTILREKCHNYL